jgi:hypothetical protein
MYGSWRRCTGCRAGPSVVADGPDPAWDQDRVGTISRTLAAISAGIGA